MEYRAGCDLTPSSGEAEARDTLNTVLVCLSLLLFTLLLSCRAARLRRESLSAHSGGGAFLEIGGLRRAAGALVLPPLAFFFKLALETWRSVPDPGGAAGCSARINVWASLLVLATALLRYWDLTVIQPQAQASDGELEQERE